MKNKTYRLFGELAARYDLHTPPGDYRPDHDFVLEELHRFGPGVRVLDLGCGTGPCWRASAARGWRARGSTSRRRWSPSPKSGSAPAPSGSGAFKTPMSGRRTTLSCRTGRRQGRPVPLPLPSRVRRRAGRPAQYVYSCRSLNELLDEEHVLNLADVHLLAGLLREAGFSEIQIYDNCRREPLLNALAPYILGTRQI